MAYSMNTYLLALRDNYVQSPGENDSNKRLTIANNNFSYFPPSITHSPLFKKQNILIKRLFDIVISVAVILLLFWWMLPLIALLIKLDSSGPVFFIQKRNKKNGLLFGCIKFRTMLVNEDADLRTAIVNDNRITVLGAFLRKTHLDELPQFINVLLGDMSVIGPRPHMVTENAKFNWVLNFYSDRHLVKPGITGLAQSHGYHGPVIDLFHLDKKIKYDLFYIKNWSVVMDVKILIRTIGMIFRKLKPVQ